MRDQHIEFPNWTKVRDALESAYQRLGLQMVVAPTGGQHYPVNHWNIAGLVYEEAQSEYKRFRGKCLSCPTELSYETVIRCLDCRATLCEACAPGHFGPGHVSRSAQAHR